MKKQGFITVLAAVGIQLTLGIAYIWSVFQTGIANNIFDGNNASAALTFAFLLAALSVGSLIGGQMAIKYSTRLVVFIGGILLFVGFFVASFVTASVPWLMWVSYGAIGGFGIGLTYSTTIACAQKWYPHKKGMITGIIVGSLGFGTAVFTPIARYLLIPLFGGVGDGEATTIMILSFVFLVVCTLGSLFLKDAPEGYTGDVSSAKAKTSDAQKPKKAVQAVKSLTPMEMIRKPQYYLITLAFALASMGGLMMIGFAKPIAEAKELGEAAAVGVIVIALTNALGRLLWGAVSDKLGRINTMLILLAGTVVLALLVDAAGGFMLFVVIAFIGFFYGGLLSNFPALTADTFGPKNVSVNYGCVLLGFGAGAIASQFIAGYYRDVAKVADDISQMLPAFIIASVCAAVGIGLLLLVRVLQKKESSQELPLENSVSK
jgi:OFA family oxalate/formate antiporter-like MFS transporter